MIPIISVVGKSKSGKTTFICSLIKELNKRGYNVGTIKHTPSGFDILPQKDNFKHFESGAKISCCVCENEVLLISKLQSQSILAIIDNYFEDVDIVLVEGYKHENFPKILISPEKGKFPFSNIFLTVKNGLSQEAVKEAADMIEEKYIKKKKESVEIKIKNKKIPLNPFVQEFVKNTILGMLSSLKGGSNIDGDISIKIRR